MKIAVEISLYPFQSDYERPVLDFVRRLHTYDGITVFTNELSTQVTGDYDVVMPAVQEAMRTTFEQEGTYSFVCKVLNRQIVPGQEVAVD